MAREYPAANGAAFSMLLRTFLTRPTTSRRRAITVAARAMPASSVMFGGVWIGPGSGVERGDGDRADLGQPNADATVAAALDASIVEFDTAPWYGAGASEERLGRALARLRPGPSCLVITKAGRLFREPDGATPCRAGFDAPGRAPLSSRVCANDFTAAGARTSLAESLERLGLGAAGVRLGLRIHDPNDNSNNRVSSERFDEDEVDTALDGERGMVAGLSALRAEGAIAHVGLGMNCNREGHMGAPEEVVRLVNGAAPETFDSALLAGGWNLLSQAGLPCYSACEARGVAVHVAGVFASGLLAHEEGLYAYRAAPTQLLERAARWRELAARRGHALPALAIAFATLPACVDRVVIGMATPDQVRENLEWFAESAEVAPDVWHEAKAVGLLDARVPTP